MQEIYPSATLIKRACLLVYQIIQELLTPAVFQSP